MTESSSPFRSGAILAMACLLLGWLDPFHFRPWTTFWNDALAAAALCVLLIYLAREPLVWRTAPLRAGFLFLVAALPTLQYATGRIDFFGDAWLYSLLLAAAGLAYLAGFWTGRRKPESDGPLQAFAVLCVIAAVLSSAIALRQAFGVGSTLVEYAIQEGSRPGANLGQPNQLSSLLLWGLISVVYLFLRDKLSRIAFFCLVLPVGIALAAVQSRMAVLVLLVLLFWLFRGLRLSAEPFGRAKAWPVLVALGSTAALWFAWPDVFVLLSGVDLPRREAGDPYRLGMLWLFFDASLLKPWAGWGWGQIPSAQVAVAANHPPSLYTESSHNLLLDLVVWNGWIIGLAIAGMLAVWLLAWLRRCTSLGEWYGLGLLLVMATHSMLEFPLYYAYFLLPVALIAGLLDSGREGLRVVALRRSALVLALVAGTLGLAVTIRDYSVLQEQIDRLWRASTPGQAVFVEADSARDTREPLVLTQVAAQRELYRLSPHDVVVPVAYDELAQIVPRYPSAIALFSLAKIQFARGESESAARNVCMIRKLHGKQFFQQALEFLGDQASNVGFYCDLTE